MSNAYVMHHEVYRTQCGNSGELLYWSDGKWSALEGYTNHDPIIEYGGGWCSECEYCKAICPFNGSEGRTIQWTDLVCGWEEIEKRLEFDW